MTSRIAEQFSNVVQTRIANVAPANASGLGYHLRRFTRHVAAIEALWSNRRSHSVAYFSLPGGFGLIYSAPVLLIARFLSYKVWLHHHSFSYIHKKSLLASLAFKAAGPSHLSLVLCDCMGDGLGNLYSDISHTHVLPNAWMIPPSDLRSDSNEAPLILGHLSNLTASKGLDTVLATFAELRRREVRVQLALAGPFGDATARTLVESAMESYPAEIICHGAIYGDPKTSFLRGIDVFMFASRYVNEAQPLVVDEALAAGCVVIAAERGCIRADSDDSLAISVLPGTSTPAEFADQVQRFSEMRNRSEAAQAAAASRRKVALLALQDLLGRLQEQ